MLSKSQAEERNQPPAAARVSGMDCAPVHWVGRAAMRTAWRLRSQAGSVRPVPHLADGAYRCVARGAQPGNGMV